MAKAWPTPVPAPIVTGERPGSFDDIPKILHEIAEVAGPDVARKLAWDRGGTFVYIPGNAAPGHWLVSCVGQAAADAICGHYRILNAEGRAVGVRLQIPLAETGAMGKAKRRFVELVSNGDVSTKQAARMCGLHERTATRIVAKLQRSPDDRQGDLFGR